MSWQDTNAHVRGQTAKQYREIRKLLRNSEPLYEIESKPSLLSKIGFALLITGICILGSCKLAHAQEFSDMAYVNAIYLAEGGNHAQYPYGIKSIKCTSESLCRNICLTTVRNNKRRYKEYGYKIYPRFIQFLGSRFCPTTDRNLTQIERKLNQYWIKNVEYFLHRRSL